MDYISILSSIPSVKLSDSEIKKIGEIITNYNLGIQKGVQTNMLKGIVKQHTKPGMVILLGCTEVSEMMKNSKLTTVDTMSVLVKAILLCIQNGKYIFLKKSRSDIHGLGIFTTKLIKNNEVFYKVPLTNISKYPKRGWAKIGKSKWVGDGLVLNLVNHSCKPNTVLKLAGGKPILKALRNIKAGEEITCDYSATELGGKKVKCQCGSISCRGYFLRVE